MLNHFSALRIPLKVMMIVFLLHPAAAFPGEIRIDTEPGVPAEAAASAKLAADSTLRFFKEIFARELQGDVYIRIVGTPESYAVAFLKEGKINQKEAERRARTTIGWSIGEGLILQNVGAPFHPNHRRRLYNIGHELTHKYQAQECLDRCPKILWMYEGVAGAFAAKIVEMAGERELAKQKESWLQEVRKLSKRPGLDELVSPSDWRRGLDRYGSDPLYSFAGLAVIRLIEAKGYGSIFVYFDRLKDHSPEEAFRAAFGIDRKEYESAFGADLDKLLSAKGK